MSKPNVRFLLAPLAIAALLVGCDPAPPQDNGSPWHGGPTGAAQTQRQAAYPPAPPVYVAPQTATATYGQAESKEDLEVYAGKMLVILRLMNDAQNDFLDTLSFALLHPSLRFDQDWQFATLVPMGEWVVLQRKLAEVGPVPVRAASIHANLAEAADDIDASSKAYARWLDHGDQSDVEQAILYNDRYTKHMLQAGAQMRELSQTFGIAGSFSLPAPKKPDIQRWRVLDVEPLPQTPVVPPIQIH